MGYFRIFYYITYILNFLLRLIKRHGKAILWFVCIAVFLVLCMYNPKSYGAYLGDDSYYDPYYAIQQKYDSICLDFVRRFDNYRNQVGVADNVNLIINNFKTLDYYIYYQATTDDDYGVSSIGGGIYNDTYIRVVFYQTSNFGLEVSPSIYDNYYNISDDVRSVKYTRALGNYRAIFNYTGMGLTLQPTVSNSIYFIPQSLFHYNSQIITDYFINNYDLKEIELLYEMRNKLTSVDETLQQQQDYLESYPDSDNFSTSDLPTDSGVTNPTTTSVDNIFTTIYNVFTGNVEYAKRNITVTIPFTRKEF